jgi:hypothetical protein
MHTKSEPVTGSIQIWAIPRSTYELTQNPELSPFTYQLCTSTPWQTGAVRVSTHEVILYVPAGVNLLAAALETLELKKKEAFDYYARQVKEIDEQVQQLLRLAGPSHASPEENEANADALVGDWEPEAAV